MRLVSVFVFSYPKDIRVPIVFPLILDDIGEVLEQEEKFFTDRSLEDILSSYVDKTKVFATNFDDVNWYRVVVRDTDRRLVKIFKA